LQLTGGDFMGTDARRQIEAVIDAARADLSANAPAQDVLKRLGEIEAQARAEPALRGRWLVARGVAANRLGVRGEALGDLAEAADIFERLGDGPRLAEAKRMTALAHAWRGEGREAGLALLRAVAESLAANDRMGAALALIEAGRLEMEMGRPRAAAPLFERALAIGGEDAPQLERRRVEINRLQALVAAGDIAAAQRYRDEIEPNIASAAPRPRFLAAIEGVRCSCALGAFDEARRLIEEARRLAAAVPGSFEAVELAEAEAEFSLAEHNFELADAQLEGVIARYADDDLAGREVKARLLRATALDGLGRREEAERTLAAGLRRAVARGLIGHADAVRTRLAARGGSEGAWTLDEAPRGPSARDPGSRLVRRRPLGEGGQGSVFRAYDIELGGEVALKKFPLAALYDTARRDRLIAAARTEVLAASRIDHPGVARVRGLIVEPGGDATLIEDLVDGPTLRGLMSGPLETSRALDLVARIAFALAAVHGAGIVHCDLKPENIVMAAPTRPVIVDFGVALLDPESRMTGGTPAYMAPEQARGARADARTDLFALGVIAHELFGIQPETAKNFWSLDDAAARALLAAGIEPATVKLLRRLVAPMKWLRPGSAAKVGQAVAGAAAASKRPR
jgi:tRNA A-37 threonylcarbamoyl transferase component Bud32/tetratricopeptide (TPR) repeat protein